MAAYLSDEWLAGPHDPMAAAAGAAGIEVALVHVVTGGPQKELSHGTRASADGTVEKLLADATEGDLTFTCAFADGLALARGEVSPNVAYMRGRLKATGDTGLLLRVLAACEGDAYAVASHEVAERTDA